MESIGSSSSSYERLPPDDEFRVLYPSAGQDPDVVYRTAQEDSVIRRYINDSMALTVFTDGINGETPPGNDTLGVTNPEDQTIADEQRRKTPGYGMPNPVHYGPPYGGAF